MFYCFQCDAVRHDGHSHVRGVKLSSKKEFVGYSKDLKGRKIISNPIEKKEEKRIEYKWMLDPEKMGF